MESRVFKIEEEHRPKAALTISTDACLGGPGKVHFFSLGSYTDISPERYDCPALYIGAGGQAVFVQGGGGEQDGRKYATGCARGNEPFCPACLEKGGILFVPGGMLCGMKARETGFVYTEILMEKETKMNEILKPAEVFCLKDLIDYEKGSIANMDLASGSSAKLMILSFDEGCALAEHRAPGDALLFALEGKAVIGYEGRDYAIREGENFRFEKNGLHSVKADGRFKMALLLMLEG